MDHGKRPDMIVHEYEPYNAEPPRTALVDEPLTDAQTFYSRNHGAIPQIDTGRWRLRVDGLVANPLDLTLDQLRARFAEHSVVATLQCAGNRRKDLLAVRDIPGEAPWGPAATSTARWSGVRLGDVLRAAGLRDEAAYVEFLGPDIAHDAEPPQPFGSSIPAGKALADEVLLAWSMNGELLSPVHGAPVRVIVPGYIGARSVKWVERVSALAQPSENYFQAVAYRLGPAGADGGLTTKPASVALGAVPLSSDILSPDEDAILSAGPLTVSGYAFTPDGLGISRVEVSLDGGVRWQQATLRDDCGPWAWRLWAAQVELAPGRSELTVRTWDSSGTTQPESAEQVWNPKGYANNSWARIRVTATDG